MKSVNPYTEQVIAEIENHDDAQTDVLVDQARKTFTEWRDVAIDRRAELLQAAAKVLRANKDKYAKVMTQEMGKPITSSVAEVEKCAWVCDYYAEEGPSFLAQETIVTERTKSFVRFDPLGIVFAIMPWNFPLWQVFRCAAPALVAGNTVMLKHASNVPQSAQIIEDVFLEAGFPKGAFTTLLISASQAMRLIDSQRVDAVSLTGSNKAGEQVGQLAGKHIMDMVLELGGSDPFIVLADADIEKAAAMGVNSRFINNGQSCIAAKRFIVEESVADEFEKHFEAHMKKLVVGDPMDPQTTIGPVASKRFQEDLLAQLEDAKQKGATLTFCTDETFATGAFVVPCMVTNVTPDMRVVTEEVFGPVAPIIRVKDADEAIAVANSSEYGLGSALWSNDLAKAEELAGRIESGAVNINYMTVSDPRLPFGGVKKSGVGRELSHYGVKEFVNIKSVVIEKVDADGEIEFQHSE